MVQDSSGYLQNYSNFTKLLEYMKKVKETFLFFLENVDFK